MSRQFVLRSIGPVAVCVLTLSACGSQAAPPPVPVQGQDVQAVLGVPPAQNIQCGTVPASGGAQAKVTIREGVVECAEAVTVLTQYFGRLTAAAAASPDGAGPIAIDPWTCGSDAGSVVTATCSTEDGREIDAEPAR
ncbi:hypothetical protein [Amycolatopsis pithecellobii]|uniref:DUF4333 domain-containing protein n=1 Tax=Amycolatopsis pithecellobii TaxID=664692 RepID=A0A6N7Z9Y1_9PSEU|nr:hypothetical protein [Amycolatopsis pithecellobii]MTD58545.1 hypothetical protein [Amycolatopsis pithecellobii]